MHWANDMCYLHSMAPGCAKFFSSLGSQNTHHRRVAPECLTYVQPFRWCDQCAYYSIADKESWTKSNCFDSLSKTKQSPHPAIFTIKYLDLSSVYAQLIQSTKQCSTT